MIWLELLVVLACIFVGARLSGIGLGTVAGLGLVVLVFIFGLPPGMPPRTVLGMILCVVTAAATMQAAGGLDYLVVIADGALRIWPAGITIVAPIVAYVFTLAAGTGHIVYALLPVIAEVSRSAGVRPERPLSISVIASQQAITASPISAATVALLGLLGPSGVQLYQILLICIPSTLLGSLLGALAVMWKGPELKDDPDYQERLAKGLIAAARFDHGFGGREPDAGTRLCDRVYAGSGAGCGAWALPLVTAKLHRLVEWPGKHRDTRHGAGHHDADACGSRYQHAGI